MLRSLRLVSLFILLLASHLKGFSQNDVLLYPDSVDQRVRYEIMIEMPKAYVSGLLIMHKPSDSLVNASIVNEFGISLMDFTYNEIKDKVKFHSLTDKLNKWYIRKTLGNDLKKVLKSMKEGSTECTNNKRKIKYSFHLANELE